MYRVAKDEGETGKSKESLMIYAAKWIQCKHFTFIWSTISSRSTWDFQLNRKCIEKFQCLLKRLHIFKGEGQVTSQIYLRRIFQKTCINSLIPSQLPNLTKAAECHGKQQAWPSSSTAKNPPDPSALSRWNTVDTVFLDKAKGKPHSKSSYIPVN